MRRIKSLFLLSLGLLSYPLFAQEEEGLKSSTLSALTFRSIGPAKASGRIADIAVNPENYSEYFLAGASGGLWRTVNAGTTYEPVFDSEASYSIACVAYAPSNTKTIWVGTGENNNQRAIGYGDGVYKSTDGGSTWTNMGLKESEHIGKIIIHPEDENTVYVAAYGPLWSAGGERGFYMTTDGGATWTQTLYISENTGISDIAMDPSNPDILYAAAHQRRRHVHTYISGGPESAAYKSTDGGRTWNKMTTGLPNGEMGRIEIAVSPADPNYVYLMCEAMYDQAGVYLSTDKGSTWSKKSSYSTSGNYYTELVCDPDDRLKVFSMDTWLHHTVNGGASFERTGEEGKHVDNHAMWIDPSNTNHWLVGCDGGLYETWDHAANWQFKPNLPITQFYRVAVDNSYPFYNVYGGTQDNFSLGGPSRTLAAHGASNDDWFVTNGGDGFESQVDPTDPNIVYAQAQYGWLVRYDRRSGEKIGIQPTPGKDEEAYRWNWDAPLLISPHNPQRLYFCANKVFVSNDRGNSWQTISPDLSRGIDRNSLEVMGRIWSVDAVAKNKSTTIYGNIVSFDESPLQEGLLFAGTDDGLIHISASNGDDWTTIESIKNVPERTYVNALTASLHDPKTVYAAFNNVKNGDFKPYVYVSTDLGKSWTDISSNLPERGSVYSIKQDHIDPNLLFVGTEFGVFVSQNGGESWIQLKSGIPTIPVRDIEIAKRDNDLVLATFGRGFYVLDDYSPLRVLSEESLAKAGMIYPIRKAYRYHPSVPLGHSGKAHMGASYYTAENPAFGLNFYYSLGDDYTSLADQRKKEEAENRKAGEDNPYPSMDELRQEREEFERQVVFVIRNQDGEEIQRLSKKASKGLHTMNWDLRLPTTSPIRLNTPKPGRYSSGDQGPMVPEGEYTVQMYLLDQNGLTRLSEAVEFEIEDLNLQSIPADREEKLAFELEVMELNRQLQANNRLRNTLNEQIQFIEKAVLTQPAIEGGTMADISAIKDELRAISLEMDGDPLKSKLEMEQEPTVNGRVGTIRYLMQGNDTEVTQTMKDSYTVAQEEFEAMSTRTQAVRSKVDDLLDQLEALNVPYIQGME